jgi:hypothetical protein
VRRSISGDRELFFEATVTEDGDGYSVSHRPLRAAAARAVVISTVKALATAAALVLGATAVAGANDATQTSELPRHLSETGLFAPGSISETRPGIMSFSPQYPLWSDGATKRRWVQLPEGAAIDATRVDVWDFPRGTRFWKEFSLGRPVETRLIERIADGSWRFATYVWNDEGTDAVLAPPEGMASYAVNGRRYPIPSETDCRVCHEGAAAPVLGFSALQLSPDRDPLAPHAEPVSPRDVTLPRLIEKGALKNLPQRFLDQTPRIAASSPAERAALGYLHANCGHCHDRPSETSAAVPVETILAQKVDNDSASVMDVLRSLLGGKTRFRSHDGETQGIVVPGNAGASLLPQRMRSRDPRQQMPPLGTAIPDAEALALIERWINQDLNDNTKEKTPWKL